MKRLFLLFLGMFLTSLGLFFIILYLTLLNNGYSFFEFVKFIICRCECLLLPIGVLIIYLIFRKG